jgi:dihydroorotate dehydrogenase electron transfer subunit
MTAPFGARATPLRSRREIGPYVVLGAIDEHAHARPGQFYMLASAERWGGGDRERPYLGRAVSVMAVADDASIAFLLHDVGPGTKRLCELEIGEGLLIVGPFGNGFTAPSPPGAEALLVGGGIGIAPLVGLQRAWGGQALLGFRNADHAQAAELFSDPIIATDDGSTGHNGLVTDLLEAELNTRPRAIYACGPPAMLKAVRDRAAAHEVGSQLALEAPMACGFGACYGCVVATLEGYRRVCVDGPVFDGALLA